MRASQLCHPYIRVLEPFSKEELARLCQVKRVFEWAQGDRDFCESMDAGNLKPEDRERLTRIGILFDLSEIALLWEQPAIAKEYIEKCTGACGCAPDLSDVSAETLAIVKQYPLLELWARYISRKNSIYREMRKRISRVPQNSQFDAWRMRRIAAVRSELGFFGHFIDHPILAFELGDGCSVGCWFCAFAARKLTKNYDYAENRDSFRKMIQTCVDLFGSYQASMTLLYYGTEPHDNHHYLDFMKEFRDITGNVVCTSTAVGTDAKWIRELIAYYREETHPWPRLSVLSKGQMHKIHDLYSPEELRDVELLMQMKEHPRKKVTGGRILEETSGLRDRADGHYLDEVVPQGSIACVSGFLTNLVNQTIQLVSPCYTSNRYPYGYRVFDETTYSGPADFGRAMQDLMDRNMPASPPLDRRARFRDDLVFRPMVGGFDLVSPNQIHHLRGQETYAPIGKLIAEGIHTFQELYDVLISTDGLNPMVAAATVQKLFDEGFMDEVNPDYARNC